MEILFRAKGVDVDVSVFRNLALLFCRVHGWFHVSVLPVPFQGISSGGEGTPGWAVTAVARRRTVRRPI